MDKREIRLGQAIEAPRPTILAATAALLLAALGLWIASLLASQLQINDAAARELIFCAIYYLPFIALPIVLYAARRPGLSTSLRLNPLPVVPTLAVVSVAMLSVYLASAADGLWGLMLDALGLHAPDVSVDLDTPRALTLAILSSAALPAIFEELLCRGFVFSAFETHGTRFSIWLSALMFALLHGNVYGLPAYFLVGAVSAVLVFALDSLYAGMVYHTVYNAFILVTLYMLPQMSEDAAASQSPAVLSILIDVVTFGLLMFLLLRMLDRRRRLLGIEPVPRVSAPLRRSEWALLAALFIVFIGTSVLVLTGV